MVSANLDRFVKFLMFLPFAKYSILLLAITKISDSKKRILDPSYPVTDYREEPWNGSNFFCKSNILILKGKKYRCNSDVYYCYDK